MTKPMIREHNVESNEIVDREMTNAEYAEYEAQQALAIQEKEADAKANADKEAAISKLAALGLTTDDLKALGL